MTAAPSTVTSRENPLAKDLRRLGADPAAYRKLGRIWVEGEHLVQALQASRQVMEQVECFVIAESFLNEKNGFWPVDSARAAIKLIVFSDALMRDITAMDSPPRVGAVLRVGTPDGTARAVLNPINALNPLAPTVVLDRLQDPGNVGSILRSAAAMGFGQVAALKGSAAMWSPKVLRAGMGAHFALNVVEQCEPGALEALQRPLAATSSHRGQWLHELQKEAFSLSKTQLPAQALRPETAKSHVETEASLASVNWLFGHEGQGASPELIARAKLLVRIAQPGGQESLNVASAAAICLYASAVAVGS